MPAKSKRQFRKFKVMEEQGKVSKKVADEFTKGVDYAKLPEKVRKKQVRKK